MVETVQIKNGHEFGGSVAHDNYYAPSSVSSFDTIN